MTVPTTTSTNDFIGNGATSDFSPNYVAMESADLVVSQTVAGVTTALVLGVGYTIVGDVTQAGAWNIHTTVAVPNLAVLHVTRTLEILQNTSFRTQGSFSPVIHEAALDRGCMIEQQLDRRVTALEAGGAVVSATPGNGLALSGSQWNVLDGTGLVIDGTNHVSLDYSSADPTDLIKVARAARDLGSSPFPARVDHQHDASTAAAVALAAGGANAEGVASTLARSDHTHAMATAAPVNVTKAAAAAGAAATFAASDHKHDVTTAAAVELTDAANAEGAATSLARSDHTHAHGTRGGGGLHPAATSSVAGFMSAADKTKLDGIGATRIAVQRTTTQTLADGVPTTILFATVEYDLLTEYSTGTGIFTATTAGYYLITAGAALTANGTLGHNFQIVIGKNGLVVTRAGTIDTCEVATSRILTSHVSSVVKLAAGDTIRIWAEQVAVATLDLLGTTGVNFLTIDRLA